MLLFSKFDLFEMKTIYLNFKGPYLIIFITLLMHSLGDIVRIYII